MQNVIRAPNVQCPTGPESSLNALTAKSVPETVSLVSLVSQSVSQSVESDSTVRVAVS